MGQSLSGNVAQLVVLGEEKAAWGTLIDELADRGFTVRNVDDAVTLLAQSSQLSPNDVLLLGHTNRAPSLQVLAALRRDGVRAPIAFVSWQVSPEQEHRAFDHGADDVIDKRRGVDVIARRLRRLMKGGAQEAQRAGTEIEERGPLTLRQDIGRAEWKGVDLGLTYGEFNVAALLVSSADRFVSYREIYDRMHYVGFVAGSGDNGYQANVRSTIKRIRKKFLHIDPAFDGILNLAGVGYRWQPPGTDA
jgi:two-component system response regulator ChvI